MPNHRRLPQPAVMVALVAALLLLLPTAIEYAVMLGGITVTGLE